MAHPIVINPKNHDSGYIAIDYKNRSTILAEGSDIEEVISKADKLGQDYSIMFMPKEGQTFVY